MSVHEPLLYIVLSYWKQPREERLLLEPQYPQRIHLRNVPDLVLLEDCRTDNLGHAVEEVRYYPVEHLDEEWELLQQSAVQMVGESRRVGSAQSQTAPQISPLR